MDVSNITNNHLKDLLKKILNTEYLNEVLLLNLTNELRFATLICAGSPVDEFSFNYPMFDLEDGTSILPLFTDEQEFYASELNIDGLEPVPYYFEHSFELLDDESVNGILINPDTEEFFVPKDIINLVAMSQIGVSNSLDNDSSFACDGNDLKLIFDTISNDTLVEFLNDDNNAFDYDGLFNEFSKSMLSTIVICEDLEKNFDDIYPVDPANISLFREIDEEENSWLVLISNKDTFYNLVSFQGDQSDYYAQLVNPEELAIYALEHDFEGIKLYNEEEYIPIPRSILLEKIDSIKILCHNPRLNNSINYALR